jgi:DNA-binding NarL/FixJ family response regulator
MRIRVFIADDHELVRYALRTMLEAESDIEVVGEACDSPTAIAGCLEAKPDVLVLDLRMPGGGGIEV